MDDLDYLRSRIPAYADYGDEGARHLVDKQVRAYVGEALSALQERLSLSGALLERIERTLMLCEFTNQQLMHVLDHARFGNGEVEQLHEVDHRLIETADRSGTIEVKILEEYLGEVESLFARRVTAVFTPA